MLLALADLRRLANMGHPGGRQLHMLFKSAAIL